MQSIQHGQPPTIQFIPYDIQEITNKDIYRTIIKKPNSFISEESIISVYDIEEKDINKFKRLIMNTKYIQNIEQTHESKQKGKYFMIPTKTDYKKVVIEVKELVKYIYPDRNTEDLQTPRQINNNQIININVSTYAQYLMQFHDLTCPHYTLL